MKIALINFEEEAGYLPMAAPYLAGYLREKGYKDIKIIDGIDTIDQIKEYNPDIIGMGVYSSTYYRANEFVKKVKCVTKSPIIAGGPHIYCMPEQIKNSNFDLGVVGEGEVTLYELVSLFEKRRKFELEDLRKIDGLVFVNEKGKLERTKPRALIENIDEIPMPAIDLLKLKEHYLIPGPAGASFLGVRGFLVTSRGCPYNCVFCASKSIWTKVRWHSAERTVAEIKKWVNQYGATHFYVYDDLFVANRLRLKKIIWLLKKEKLLGKVDFEILCRANLVDEELVGLLKELNVSTVPLGFETGSDKILNSLKGDTVTVAHGKRAIKLLYNAGIRVTGAFMVGNPYETEEDLQKTFEMASDPRISVLHVSYSIAFPGTKFWEYGVKNKIYPKDFWESGKFLTQDVVDFNCLLSKEISKEKFTEYWNKFMKLNEEKIKKYNPKFEPKQIKLMMQPRFLKKLWKKRKWLKLHIWYLMNNFKRN
mgnify:CR=1 FL=1